MKNEVIELVQSKKLKKIVNNGGSADDLFDIKPKTESEAFVRSALMFLKQGDIERSEEIQKKALAARVLELNIEFMPNKKKHVEAWYQSVLNLMKIRVDSVFGKNSFKPIESEFINRY
ncbi:TPA: hypothetical protein ACGIK9_003363 [Acinetobacter baumannii]|uniref:hypothetical protein n=1 Tax=Acinetobacter baumannii TaxID=470 RepID=UPI00338D68F8